MAWLLKKKKKRKKFGGYNIFFFCQWTRAFYCFTAELTLKCYVIHVQ